MKTFIICTLLACSLNLLHGQNHLKINPIRVDSSFDDVSLSKLNPLSVDSIYG